MHKLIKEISAIVSQYGVDIVTEERFVNIMKDLHPDRDHPEKFDILKAIVDEGVSSIMLSTCNAKTAKSFITNQAKSLSQKYGYNIQNFTQELSCLCIGCNCITIDDYNRLFNPQKPKPTPTKPQPTKPKKKRRISNIIYMVLGYLGFFVTPIIMLLHHSGRSLFLTLLIVWAVQAITIIPCALGLYKSRPNYLYGGLFCGLMLSLAVYVFFGSFEYDKELMEFCGIDHDYNSPFILTVLFAFILYFGGAGFGSEIAGIDTSDVWGSLGGGGSFDDFKPIWQSLSNFRFIIGMLISILVCALLYYTIHTFPISYSFINNSVIKITENRGQKNVELSFMDFKLGSSIDSCISVIAKSPRYFYSNEDQFNYQESYTESKEVSHNLCVQGFYYSTFIDSVIVIGSELDNSRILIKLYSNKNKVFAIEYLTHQNPSILKESYKTKYGMGKCQDVVYLSRQFEPILEQEANDRIIREEKQEKKQKMIEEQKKQEARKREEEELKELEDAHQKAIDEI